jgi:hypothetical protein
MYDNPDAPDILKQFRLKCINPQQAYREILLDQFGVPHGLVTELYRTHANCRLRLARVELKVCYQIFRVTKQRFSDELDRYGDYNTSLLMSLQNQIHHIGKLEEVLGVPKTRAQRLRQEFGKALERIEQIKKRICKQREKEAAKWRKERLNRKRQCI